MKVGGVGGPPKLPDTPQQVEGSGKSQPETRFEEVLNQGKTAGTQAARNLAGPAETGVVSRERISELTAALKSGAIGREEFAAGLAKEVARALPVRSEQMRVQLEQKLVERLQEDPTLAGKLDAILKAAQQD